MASSRPDLKLARVPAPVWPDEPPQDAHDSVVAEYARRSALAMSREEGYIGADYDRMLHLGFPEKGVMGDWTFESYPATTKRRQAALAVARQFAADPHAWTKSAGRWGIAMGGHTGRTKTSLAVAMGWEMNGRGLSTGTAYAVFVSWPDLLHRIYKAVRQPKARPGSRQEHLRESVTDIVEHATEAEVLILDDLGEQGGSELPPFAMRVLREILWSRYDAQAPTVITTNLNATELETQVREAAMSRLFEMKWLVLDGADERRAALEASA